MDGKHLDTRKDFLKKVAPEESQETGHSEGEESQLSAYSFSPRAEHKALCLTNTCEITGFWRWKGSQKTPQLICA